MLSFPFLGGGWKLSWVGYTAVELAINPGIWLQSKIYLHITLSHLRNFFVHIDIYIQESLVKDDGILFFIFNFIFSSSFFYFSCVRI